MFHYVDGCSVKSRQAINSPLGACDDGVGLSFLHSVDVVDCLWIEYNPLLRHDDILKDRSLLGSSFLSGQFRNSILERSDDQQWIFSFFCWKVQNKPPRLMVSRPFWIDRINKDDQQEFLFPRPSEDDRLIPPSPPHLAPGPISSRTRWPREEDDGTGPGDKLRFWSGNLGY